MVPRMKEDKDLAKGLIQDSFGNAALREFGHYSLFGALQHVFVASKILPQGRQEVYELADDALTRVVTEYNLPTESAREAVEEARKRGFDLVSRVCERLTQ